MHEQRKKLFAIIAWCSYDWGISAFPVIITTFVFATYFIQHIAVNDIVGTHLWGNAMALAGVIVAMISPICGAVADYGGKRKYWLGVFTLIIIISAALLWYAYPSLKYLHFTLTCVVLGTVGLNVSMVFYNAILPNLVPAQYLGRISGWGWGLGYIGGVIALTIALVGFVTFKPSWLDVTTLAQLRICGPLVAGWLAIFSLPLFLFVPDYPAIDSNMSQAVKHGLNDLWHTLKSLLQQKDILTFLIAQMIYNDGLVTIFAFGGIYAAGTFHMSIIDVLIFGIFMNISAGCGSLMLAWLDDYAGSKFTILLSLLLLTIFGLGIVMTVSKIGFWLFAGLFGLFIGPVQSSSRSFMARLVPKENATKMFGLYIFSGKISTFIGPWVLGMVTLMFNSQRVGMGVILLFFIIGAAVLARVREPKLNR